MSVRILALIAFCFFATGFDLALAGDFPGDPSCKGENCNPPEQGPETPNPPMPPEHPNPGPQPGAGFCAGVFQGFYMGQPGPVVFQIHHNGQFGELRVVAWWRGGMWHGQGLCRQLNPWQAAIELYFPNAPVHRGVVSTNGSSALLEGQIDFGFYFRLGRGMPAW